MVVKGCCVDLLIYDSQSLKNKRQVIKSLVNRIKERYNVSIAEVDYLDVWNRCALGIVTVSNTGGHALEMIDKVIGFIDNDERVEILSVERSFG